MHLVTAWFGCFLLENGEVRKQILFPKDAEAIAQRLARMDDWEVLGEEREIVREVSGGFYVAEPRLSKIGGIQAPERPPPPEPEPLGFDYALLREATVLLAKIQMRKSARPDDHLRQAIKSLDATLSMENLLQNRVKDWYSFHFPELRRLVADSRYLEYVIRFGKREAIPLPYADSVGSEIEEEDLRALQDLALLAQQTAASRRNLEKHIEQRVAKLAPNLTALLGPILGARMIASAKNLENLAFFPTSTVQILGAENAFFRHRKGSASSPKHGLLFRHPAVHLAPIWQRGAIARSLAAKVSLAARADHFTKRDLSNELTQTFDRDLESIRRRKASPPPRRGRKGTPAVSRVRRKS